MKRHLRPTSLLHTLAAVVVLALFAIAPGHAAGFDLGALMAMLAEHPHGRVSFVETRHLALLDQAIESRGELVYVPPDRLERHAHAPREESAILEGDTLTLIRDGRSRQLSLSDYPEVGVLIGSLRAVLAGDHAALARDFELTHAGTPDAWILDLVPKAPALAADLRRIHLVGSAGEVSRVEMIEPDGDRAVIAIGATAP